MEDNENKFFFEGKYYSTEKDFSDAVREWHSNPLDAETAERKLDHIKNDILMNVYMNISFSKGEVTNLDYQEYLSDVFVFSMVRLQKLSMPEKTSRLQNETDCLIEEHKRYWDSEMNRICGDGTYQIQGGYGINICPKQDCTIQEEE